MIKPFFVRSNHATGPGPIMHVPASYTVHDTNATIDQCDGGYYTVVVLVVVSLQSFNFIITITIIIIVF
jgi:hypothetical protein